MKDFYITMVSAGLSNFSMYPRNFNYECAVKSAYSFVIGPTGEIYPCWENIGHGESIIGTLNEKGEPNITNETSLIRYLSDADYILDIECQKCICFPICSGGCPEKRLRNKHCNACFDVCSLYKNNMEDMLDLHYYTKSILKQE
jgi:uncharacterized protein